MTGLVLDRFHVVRWFTQGFTLVRREIQRRDPQLRPPTFEPASPCCAEPTISPKPTKHTSTASTPPGTLSKSSTSSTNPKASIKPTRPPDGSPTSTPPDRYPNTVKSSTPSSHGEKKYSPTTTY